MSKRCVYINIIYIWGCVAMGVCFCLLEKRVYANTIDHIVFIHVGVWKCMRACVCVCVCVHVSVCLYLFVYWFILEIVCVCLCVCFYDVVCACVFLCVRVCLCRGCVNCVCAVRFTSKTGLRVYFRYMKAVPGCWWDGHLWRIDLQTDSFWR